jgi:hypothetical protein
VHVERLREVADLREPRSREGVGRPRRDLVEIEVRDDLRLDPAMTGQLACDHLGRAFVADEQASLRRAGPQRDAPCGGAREQQRGGERDPQEQRLPVVERPGDDQPARQQRDERAQRGQLKQLRRLV